MVVAIFMPPSCRILRDWLLRIVAGLLLASPNPQ